MKTTTICRDFARAGAVICGLAGAAYIAHLLPNVILWKSALYGSLGTMATFVFVTGVAEYFAQDSETKQGSIAKAVSKSAFIGAACGATGAVGFVGALCAASGYVAGAIVGWPIEAAVTRYQAKKKEEEPHP